MCKNELWFSSGKPFYSSSGVKYSCIENTLFVSNNKKIWSHCRQYSFLLKSAKTLLISLLASFTLAEGMASRGGRATQREGQKISCSPDFNSSFIYSWPCCCQHCQEKIWDLLRDFSSSFCHSTTSVSGTRNSFGVNGIVRTRPKHSWV